jgi:hypothetical protein
MSEAVYKAERAAKRTKLLREAAALEASAKLDVEEAADYSADADRKISEANELRISAGNLDW